MLNALLFAATVGTLTVDAGAFDRANTPVVVDIPAELADQRLELHAGGKKAALLQALPDGRGVFILPSLAKGQTTRFDVVEPTVAPEAAVVVDVEADGLELRVGGARAFRYQMTGRAPSADVPANAVRGGYIHPVLTPSGVAVTDDYHPKHRAHHGIWTAWTAAQFEGRKISFWGSSSGRNDFVALDGVWSGVVAGGFAARHASTDLSTTPAKPVLDEEWKVVLYRTHETAPPYFLFDLEWTDRAASPIPLVLPEYRYGGLGLRGHAAWDGEPNLLVLTSDGDRNRTSAEGARVRWIHMGARSTAHWRAWPPSSTPKTSARRSRCACIRTSRSCASPRPRPAASPSSRTNRTCRVIGSSSPTALPTATPSTGSTTTTRIRPPPPTTRP